MLALTVLAAVVSAIFVLAPLYNGPRSVFSWNAVPYATWAVASGTLVFAVVVLAGRSFGFVPALTFGVLADAAMLAKIGRGVRRARRLGALCAALTGPTASSALVRTRPRARPAARRRPPLDWPNPSLGSVDLARCGARVARRSYGPRAALGRIDRRSDVGSRPPNRPRAAPRGVPTLERRPRRGKASDRSGAPSGRAGVLRASVASPRDTARGARGGRARGAHARRERARRARPRRPYGSAGKWRRCMPSPPRAPRRMRRIAFDRCVSSTGRSCSVAWRRIGVRRRRWRPPSWLRMCPIGDVRRRLVALRGVGG